MTGPNLYIRPRPAFGRVGGHCGELLQGRWGPGGPVALVTLPWPDLAARAYYAPAPGAPLMVRVRGEGAHPPSVARRAARAALARLGRAGRGGRLAIDNPAPVGGGAGSSSMDALSAIRAVAAAFGAALSPDEEASLALQAEGAVDPLMHREPIIFASREGRVLDVLPPAPRMLAVGGFDGPGCATAAISTSALDIRSLARRLEAAFVSKDLAKIGAVATESAEADQAAHAKPHWEELRALAAETQALGLAVSHSGSAVALLFAPDQMQRARSARSAMVEMDVASPRLFRPFG